MLRRSRWIPAVLVILLLMTEGLAVAHPGQAVPAAVADGAPAGLPETPAVEAPARPVEPSQAYPIRIVSQTFNAWTFGGGFLYWSHGDTFMESLKRQPEYSLVSEELKSGGTSWIEFDHMVADDTGVYYAYGNSPPRIEARYTDDPHTPHVLTSVSWPTTTLMVLDDSYVYFNMYLSGGAGGIYRTNKLTPTGGSARISDAQNLTALAVGATHIYWADADGLWRSDKTCTSPSCWNQKEMLLDLEPLYGDIVTRLSWADADHLLVIQENDIGFYIHRCPADTICHNGIIHSELRSEVRALNAAVIKNNRLFYTEARVGSTLGLIRRKNLDAPWEHDTIYEGEFLDLDKPIYAGSTFLLFGMLGHPSPGVYGIYFAAAPLKKDLGLLAIEVTQGIQNLDPDTQVPLVADKDTIVRVYGTMPVGSGANAAEVTLRATHSGGLPPTPPLMPLGMSYIAPGQTLGDLHRSDKAIGWLFRLPSAWVKAGTLTIEVEIDPRGIYADPDLTNNTITQQVVFETRKPVCIEWIPVHTPPGIQRTSSAIFWPMMELATRLWPTAEMKAYEHSEPVEEFEICWWGFIPYPCFGPYELDPDDDDGVWVLEALRVRDSISDDPKDCDRVGARTHYIGMVHPRTNTGTVLGQARLGWGYDYEVDQVWIKFSAPDELVIESLRWNWPASGVTLAHELGHNYELKHVNCGGPDDIGYYPYFTRTLDDRDIFSPTTHFGYDTYNLLPVHPKYNADMMSYCSPSWISDYNWRRLFSKLDTLAVPPTLPAGQQVAQGPANVLVSGITRDGDPVGGQLSYAWVYSTSMLSPGILRKWQELAIPGPDVHQAYTSTCTLRLRDAGGAIVDERVFTPTQTIDEGAPQTASFLVTFPAPASTVAQIDLLVGGLWVDSLSFGPAVPTVQILQPAAGGSYDQDMTIVWQAGDADPADKLLYSVQYSPDNGQTWTALVAGFPGQPGTDRVTLTLSAFGVLPGGDQALVRVAASDGYHTGFATVGPFQVARRAPEAAIVSPGNDEQVAAGEAPRLVGHASDAEDGTIVPQDLEWSIDGVPLFTGTDVLLPRLAPGEYDVSLTATDGDGQQDTALATLDIASLGIPRWFAEVPELDGFCDDTVYTRGVTLLLTPYVDGGQGAVHLLRTNTDLWACFQGLNVGLEGSYAELQVDADGSGGSHLQPDDYAFNVAENGTPRTFIGDGAGGRERGPQGMVARVSEITGTWNAEMRIPSTLLGGWGHRVRLYMMHSWYDGARFHFPAWPSERWSSPSRPSEWADALLDYVPVITDVSPVETVVGQNPGVVTILGENFYGTPQAYWDGQPQFTVRASTHELSVILDEAAYATAGTKRVWVDNNKAANGDTDTSNVLLFNVYNPAPVIASLSPAQATAGGPAFTLLVGGSGFVTGSKVYWNGQERPTTWVSATALTAQIGAEDIALARTVGVAVVNPEPAKESSNVVPFNVHRIPAPYQVYLPVIARNAR